MKRRCCIPNCPNTELTLFAGKPLEMYRFPAGPAQKQRWLDWLLAIATEYSSTLPNIDPLTSLVCCKHFTKDDYTLTENNTIILKESAVPSRKFAKSGEHLQQQKWNGEYSEQILITALQSMKNKFVPMVKEVQECQVKLKEKDEQLRALKEESTKLQSNLNYFMSNQLGQKLNLLLNDAASGEAAAIYILDQISNYKSIEPQTIFSTYQQQQQFARTGIQHQPLVYAANLSSLSVPSTSHAHHHQQQHHMPMQNATQHSPHIMPTGDSSSNTDQGNLNNYNISTSELRDVKSFLYK